MPRQCGDFDGMTFECAEKPLRAEVNMTCTNCQKQTVLGLEINGQLAKLAYNNGWTLKNVRAVEGILLAFDGLCTICSMLDECAGATFEDETNDQTIIMGASQLPDTQQEGKTPNAV